MGQHGALATWGSCYHVGVGRDRGHQKPVTSNLSWRDPGNVPREDCSKGRIWRSRDGVGGAILWPLGLLILSSPLSSTEPCPSTKGQSMGISLTGCRPAQRWAEVFLLFWQKWSGRVCTHESHPTHVQFSLGFTCIMKYPKFPSRYRIFGLLRMSLFSPLGVVSMTTFKLVMCYASSIHMRCACL